MKKERETTKKRIRSKQATTKASGKPEPKPAPKAESKQQAGKTAAKPAPAKPALKQEPARPAPAKVGEAKATSKPAAARQAPPPNTPLPDEAALGWFERAAAFILRFRRYGREVLGFTFILFSMLSLAALPRITWLTGTGILDGWASMLRRAFGFGSVLLVLLIGIGGFLFMRPRRTEPAKADWRRVFVLEAAAFSGLMLLTLLGGFSMPRAEAGLDGGVIGWGLVELVRMILEQIGFVSLVWSEILVGLAFIVFVLAGLGLSGPVQKWVRRHSYNQAGLTGLESGPAVSMAPLTAAEGSAAPVVVSQSDAQAAEKRKNGALPPEFRKKFRVLPEAAKNSPPPPRSERLPPLDLLASEHTSRPDERNINLTAGLIEKTLSEFGIPAKVVGFKVGPTVTQFAVEPGFLDKAVNGENDANKQKVRVSQISALSRDLALALSADRLRIEAPVPGRPYIGIEVPNTKSFMVRLRPILETEAFYKINSPLSIALGRDVSGSPVVADLSSMPHLLIAGTTGSGKSVCIEALTTCLVMNNTPEDLRLVMIDPKMVELVRFNGLPHIYGKVETNIERILGVLHWTVAEMDARYKLLEEMHARNLDSYNRKALRHKGKKPLPRIVVMIDELADLMMTAPEQTEPALVRLAQLARATGIHLVVATQRPSTDVVTGLIKANFPARISFAVASSIDSRVILDTTGAESLLGRGDMLFLPPEVAAPIRSQGVLITDQEVERVINFWQQALPVTEGEPAPWEEMLAEEEVLADKDDLVKKAIDVVRETRKASASHLQRRLHIGYPRAARLIDELEELGIIGPSTGGGREREVLIDSADTNPLSAVDEGDVEEEE